MIYYSIMLNNEIEMLKLQFEINYHIVDKFIIIEANKTFSGINKPYHFLNNIELFKKYEDKIIYIQVEHSEIPEDIEFENFNSVYLPYKNNWIREKNQREGFLKTMTFNDDDLIFFSDADEIVFLDKILHLIDHDKINYFNLIHCVYYVNTVEIPTQFIINTNCCYPYKIYKKYKTTIDKHFNIRKLNYKCDEYKSFDDCGYHFSYCYDLYEKLKSFSHGEDNTETNFKTKINSKNSFTKNNVIELPEIITKNIPRQFIYPPPMNYFNTIYHNNLWSENINNFSGPGATLQCSQPYLEFFQNFVKTNNIKTILDIGCGDFNLMRHFNFFNINYLGVDIVNEIIESNKIKYQTDTIKFKQSFAHEEFLEEKYDLIICKDVFQHWSNKTTKSFLKLLRNYKYCLITNDYINPQYFNKNYNVDILDSEYTVCDLTAEPYNINGEYVFEWNSCDCIKRTLLLKQVH